MIYLDNAATSWPKPNEVYDKVCQFMKTDCANPGRSSHHMARLSAAEVLKTRELLADLFHLENPMDLAFTFNATHALNIAIQGILKKGDHVVTTAMEHNSVLRPLEALHERGMITMTIVEPDDSIGQIGAKRMMDAVQPNTRMIVCSASSNLTGTILPIGEMGEFAERKGIILLVDAAQGAGVLDIDVKAMKIPLLAFPGHKGLLGPQGCGGLYVSPRINVRPLMYGGTGSRSFEMVHPSFMPDKLEAGTLNAPAIAGLGVGVEWLSKKGLANIRKHKMALVSHLHRKLSASPNIRFHSSPQLERNSGILSFIIEGMDSSEIGTRLDADFNIAVRSGFHCAPLAHKALGTLETGLVRVSPSCFNTMQEMDTAAKAIREIAANKI